MSNNYSNPYEMDYADPYANANILNPFADTTQSYTTPYEEYGNKSKASKLVLYQIAQFKNKKKNKYHVKKFTFNEDYTEMKWQEGFLTKDKIENIKRKYRKNKYHLYPVYSLDLIPHPNKGQLLQCSSELLDNDPSYTGFAPF